jgi:hypothetical protein
MPTMSNAPRAGTQLAREPVKVGSWPDWNVLFDAVFAPLLERRR